MRRLITGAGLTEWLATHRIHLLRLQALSVNTAVRATAMRTDAMASLAEQIHELATTIIILGNTQGFGTENKR